MKGYKERKNAPVIFFVYNRPEHTKRALDALKANPLASDTFLYVFSDAEKTRQDGEKVKEVRSIVDGVSGFKAKDVVCAKKNIGCADSIINGVSEIFKKHEEAIIIEDDVVVVPGFLEYMNNALSKCSSDKSIYSVSGFNIPEKIPEIYELPVYLAYRNSSWGWGTWKNRWTEVDWDVSRWSAIRESRELWKKLQRAGDDIPFILKLQMEGKIDAWDIRFCVHHILKDRFTLFPVTSFVRNTGLDGSGIHCGKSSKYDVDLDENFSVDFPDYVPVNEVMITYQKSFYRYTIIDRMRRFLKDLIQSAG